MRLQARKPSISCAASKEEWDSRVKEFIVTLYPCEAPSGAFHSGLRTVGQVKAVRKGPEEGKEDDQQTRAPLLQRKAEGDSGKTSLWPFFT